MKKTAAGVTPKPEATKSSAPTPRQNLVWLILGLAFVLGLRVLLYLARPDRANDFDLLYSAAAHLIRGEELYPTGGNSLSYPLPAVLLAVPFTAVPLWLARPIFDILVGWAFTFSLWKYRGRYALVALLSGAYLFALLQGQTTPLMVAAILIPALGFLLAVRPNSSAALWISRPSFIGVIAPAAVFLLSFAILPTWPRDWWLALPQDTKQFAPPILRPLGFILLLAAIRWRTPEGRLLFAMAFIPQTTLPYELVVLALVPANLMEMTLYLAGSWVAVSFPEWPAALGAVYVPMLLLLLRPKSDRKVSALWKERRRPNRLQDQDLKVEVAADGSGGFTCKVTHLPSGQFVSEAGSSREQAVRKAQDRLAALMAGKKLKKTA
jgi:hypothetical protein